MATPIMNEEADENHVVGGAGIELERAEGVEQVGGDDEAEEAEFGDDGFDERPTAIGYPVSDGGINGFAVGSFLGVQAVDVLGQIEVHCDAGPCVADTLSEAADDFVLEQGEEVREEHGL
jgi:hypothetical protein